MRLENRRLVSASDLLVLEMRKAKAAVDERRNKAKAEAGDQEGKDELDSYFE